MFLVRHDRDGTTYHVFTPRHPRADGYTGPVTEGARVETNPDLSNWSYGTPRPGQTSYGTAPGDPHHYREFRDAGELRAAGFNPVSGRVVVVRSWSAYLDLFGEA
jgi:hypothetical protein